MKIILLGILSGALAIGVAFAQDTPAAQNSESTRQQQSADPTTPQATPSPQQQPTANQPSANQPTPQSNSATTANTSNGSPVSGPTRIAAGSVIPVQLAKTVDVKKAKTGEEVIAKVTMDMKSNSGQVLVPKDTKVIGHVTQAQARNKEQKESELGISFDRAVTKTGEMQMPMSIQAVIAPPSMNANNNGTGGGEQATAPGPSTSPGAPSSAGRSPGAGSMAAPNGPTANTVPNDQSGSAANARPQITAQTAGVIGISDLKLGPGQSAAEGSLLSSEKNNVKLEGGTMMLLRVNQ